MTEFKMNLVENGRSTAESYLVEAMSQRSGEFAKGVIGSPFHAICDRLAGMAPAGVKIPQAALLHALREANWLDCGRIAARENPNKKHIFCAPELAGRSKSELRRMVEDGPPAGLLRVK